MPKHNCARCHVPQGPVHLTYKSIQSGRLLPLGKHSLIRVLPLTEVLTSTSKVPFKALLPSPSLVLFVCLCFKDASCGGRRVRRRGSGCDGLGDLEVTLSWSQMSAQSGRRAKYTRGVPRSLHSSAEEARRVSVPICSTAQLVCSSTLVTGRLSSGGGERGLQEVESSGRKAV